MDPSERANSDSAEAYVAQIQKQIQRLTEEMPSGQTLDAIIPLANGTQIKAVRFGAESQEMRSLLAANCVDLA